MPDIALRHRAGPQDAPVRPGRPVGRLLLDSRLGTRGAVLAIVAVLATCVGVFVAALYAASLAF